MTMIEITRSQKNRKNKNQKKEYGECYWLCQNKATVEFLDEETWEITYLCEHCYDLHLESKNQKLKHENDLHSISTGDLSK